MAAKFHLINARPSRLTAVALSWLLFAGGIGLYLYTAAARHRENPEERVTPTISQMIHGMSGAALTSVEGDADQTQPASVVQRFSRGMLWTDTLATFRRFLISMLLLLPAVVLGLHMGLFPHVGAFFLRFVLFFDKIIALSLLPILFIAFGIDELSKIMLIVVGEHVVKAFSLGASDFDVAYRVVLKQIWPRVLNSIRLNLKAVMLFLFAGEMIASTDGLAYRIALLRRHMGMDVIIPYVLWVALLLFLVDFAMRRTNRILHPWFRES